MATIEAAQLRRYYEAYPLMLNQLSQMTDDDCKKVVNSDKTTKGGKSIRSQALSVMLENFLPPSFQRVNDNLVYVKGKPVKEMSQRAAAGMVLAAQKGYLGDNKIWMSIYKDYPDIAATAKKVR